jgi:hypothetical protein
VAVTEPAYITREAVAKALDVKMTARSNDDIDRAIQSASRKIEGQLHRRFYPLDATHFWPWPNYQYRFPWTLDFDKWELAAIPTAPNAVQTGGQTIPLANIFFEPVNEGPPYTYLELNRASSSSFGVGTTPQRNISVTGTFGYSTATAPAGALVSAVIDTTGTSIAVTNGAAAGVGDVLLIDGERMLLTEKATATTWQTQQGSGCSTNSGNDVTLAVTLGATIYAGETLQLDSERMLAVDVTGNNVTVKRGWDGTVPAAHSGATVYALRSWTVTRGTLGTAAATHNSAVPVVKFTPPSLIVQYALAEAENDLLQGLSGYARTVGSADNARPVSGQALADIRAQAYAQYGRKGRKRTV